MENMASEAMLHVVSMLTLIGSALGATALLVAVFHILKLWRL